MIHSQWWIVVKLESVSQLLQVVFLAEQQHHALMYGITLIMWTCTQHVQVHGHDWTKDTSASLWTPKCSRLLTHNSRALTIFHSAVHEACPPFPSMALIWPYALPQRADRSSPTKVLMTDVCLPHDACTCACHARALLAPEQHARAHHVHMHACACPVRTGTARLSTPWWTPLRCRWTPMTPAALCRRRAPTSRLWSWSAGLHAGVCLSSGLSWPEKLTTRIFLAMSVTAGACSNGAIWLFVLGQQSHSGCMLRVTPRWGFNPVLPNSAVLGLWPIVWQIHAWLVTHNCWAVWTWAVQACVTLQEVRERTPSFWAHQPQGEQALFLL